MFFAYLAAYHTYGRYLAGRIFRLQPELRCPSEAIQDDMDYVPTKRGILFGHHFTSIAGLGPVVGPAIAVIWGWVPAVCWVVFGSIFMGAVHDFAALVISMRGQGRTIGDLAGDIVNRRVRSLFLVIIFFALWIIIAIFALIIAILFGQYPQAVLPVWIEVPIALAVGFLVSRKGMNHLVLSLAAVALLYVFVVIGTWLPFTMPSLFGIPPLALWMVLLLFYAYAASILPVQMLLQPRDYLNSHQLMVAMGLLFAGIVAARPEVVAPALVAAPAGAPPMFPFLFVVVACGAISGFHCLVSSGTSSKQCASEKDALFIGYGSMLLEAVLAALVIVAVTAGIGLGLPDGDTLLTGSAAFARQYGDWSTANGLGAKLAAFVQGSANMITFLGISREVTVTVMGVFLVSFAATTLDSATRIQRYVVVEMARAWNLPLLSGKHVATLTAVCSAFGLAFANGSGKGALLLWPLFGTVNQLLAGLALMVATVYLAREKMPMAVTGVPMVFMLLMTGWAMAVNLQRFYRDGELLLFAVGMAVACLEVWMVVESFLVWRKGLPARG